MGDRAVLGDRAETAAAAGPAEHGRRPCGTLALLITVGLPAFVVVILSVSVALGLLLPGPVLAATTATAASDPSPATDTTPPTTLVSGNDGLWHNTSVTLTFSATDELGGSGVAATWSKIDSGAYVEGLSVTIAAPADHTGDGSHTVSYYSVDAAGNAETPKTCSVLIDTTGPLIAATASSGGSTGHRVTFSYHISDDLSATATDVVLVVSDSHHKPLKRFTWAARATGTTYAVSWKPASQDTYLGLVSATDLAGNPQQQSGRATVLARGPWWTTIGHSAQKRAIVATEFGSGPRRVLLIGGVHGNEFGTPVAKRFVAYLCAHPRAVPSGARIDVIRCLDPDGRVHDTRGNARHVDLNRNLPTRNWKRALDARDEPGNPGLSGGRGPGSEPETKALLAYLKRGFRAIVSLHSHAGILDCDGPGAVTLGRRMSALCGLPVGRLSYDPFITGSLGEFAPERYRIPVVTVELKSTKLTVGMRAALLAAAAGK
jgi:protein MpaA